MITIVEMRMHTVSREGSLASNKMHISQIACCNLTMRQANRCRNWVTRNKAIVQELFVERIEGRSRTSVSRRKLHNAFYKKSELQRYYYFLIVQFIQIPQENGKYFILEFTIFTTHPNHLCRLMDVHSCSIQTRPRWKPSFLMIHVYADMKYEVSTSHLLPV